MVTDHQLAALCYDTEFTPVTWAFEGPTFHATATVEADEVIIACQGSKDLADWIKDLEAAPDPFDHHTLGLVHAGFNSTTDECLPAIVEFCSGKTIVLTGHSKGGAEAEMLAAKLEAVSIPVSLLVTFGTPRWVFAGNGTPTALLAPIPGRSYRHFKDIVTEVPFEPLWQHTANRQPVEIGTGTPLQMLDVLWMHHIASYEAVL
jgi:hypothetical protein